jgi:hypothetical protein
MKIVPMIPVSFMVLFFVAACWETGRWVKEDKTWEQYERDRNDCYMYSQEHQTFGGKMAVASAPDYVSHYRSKAFASCMEGKGYKWEPTKW